MTIVAVYFAAMLAIKSHRRHSIETRSRESAEKLVFSLKECNVRLMRFTGLITYVLQPVPDSIASLLAQGVDLEKQSEHALAPLTSSIDEYLLLSNEALRTQVVWAQLCALDLTLLISAAGARPATLTPREIAETAANAADYISRVCISLRSYLLGKPIPNLPKPIYWKSPVGTIS